MKTLTQFITERTNISLPYTFDIYNEGPKNKDYKITKRNIHNIYFGLESKYSSSILLPLPADKITYEEVPTKESTKNWTKLPKVREYTSAGAWYSDKYCEYNYYKYNKDWTAWLSMLKPYMKGKVSVTIEETEKSEFDGKLLKIVINNNKFNSERDEKIKELSDINHLKTWADEASAREKAEIEKRRKEEEEKHKAQENWDKWWNSLSDSERMSYSMGYGRGRYCGD